MKLIREAVKDDSHQLFVLYRMLVPNSRKLHVEGEQIEKIKADPMNFVFVYEDDGLLLGTITLNICLQALHGFRPYAIVENIIVHEKHRSKEIGKKLLQHVEDYCRTIECHKIMLISNSTRTRAHKFFERLGYDGLIGKGFKKYL